MSNYFEKLKDTVSTTPKHFRHVLLKPADCFNQLQILAYGIRETMPPYIVNRPHGLEAYLFVLFHDDITMRMRNQEIKCSGGNLVIWEPGDQNIFGNINKEWNHTWLVCNGRFITGRIKEYGIPLRSMIPVRDPSIFEKYLFDLHHEIMSHPQWDPDIIKNTFHSMLREISRACSTDKTAVPERMLLLKSYIDMNYHESLSLHELSRQIHMSIPYLCREFKKHFGLGAVEYLIRVRMEHAKYLLYDTSLNIGEIGIKVGYEDIYQFSKIFKKYHGCSPKKLRSVRNR
jgi:AraC-like DNA-binding protein